MLDDDHDAASEPEFLAAEVDPDQLAAWAAACPAGSYTSADDGLLPCDATSTVPAHGAMDFPLERTSFNDDNNRTPIRRTLKFAIAGGATASLAVP